MECLRIAMLKCVVLLCISQPTLCENKSSLTEISPISLPASECWDGNDGPWSSFNMQVGTPLQNLRLLPSSSGNAVWPVLPEGCGASDPSNCGDLRGTIFITTASSTWNNIGFYGMTMTEEVDLGYSGNADFGYDNVMLGWPGANLPTLTHQVIEGYVTKDLYIGSFGLNPAAVNMSSLNNPQPSFLGALVQQNHTPSTSWAYTAGAFYRQPTAFGSLTLGGYDTTRFVPNNVTFAFGPDTSRDLIVPIQSITSDIGISPLLTSVIYAYIDSLVPHIWLPLEVCRAFEEAFDLTYNETAELYFVNDTLHDKLVSKNPNVTFKLGLPGSTETNEIDIVMHYGSFDLLADYPVVNNATRYFPLKQAQNDSQYTLGRAFLQDAYVIADYDRSNFSVSQAVFPNGSNTQQIVPICRPGDMVPLTPRKALSTGGIVGIAVGAVVGSSIIVFTVLKCGACKGSESYASQISSGDEKNYGVGAIHGEGELNSIQHATHLEMPVTEPKELTAIEARRPELPTQPQDAICEMPEPTPELEVESTTHAQQTQRH